MPKFSEQSMKLNWNFLQGGGVKNKKKNSIEYVHFLEPHIPNFN